MNFIHSEAVKRTENRSLQRLIMCVYLPGREIRKRLQKKKDGVCAARQCGHISHKASYLNHPTKQVQIFSEQLGRLAPLKAMECVCISIGMSVWDSTGRPFLPVCPPSE